jgi:hypothetical protein
MPIREERHALPERATRLLFRVDPSVRTRQLDGHIREAEVESPAVCRSPVFG